MGNKFNYVSLKWSLDNFKTKSAHATRTRPLAAHSYFDSVESADWISARICSQILFLANT